MSGVIELLAFLELLALDQRGGAGPPGPPGPPAPYGEPTVPHGLPAAPPVVVPPGAGPIPPAPVPKPAPGIPTAPPVAPGVLPPMPPWPAPVVPAALPPFPGPGWVPDVPVSSAVAQRAAYWNPQLWQYSSKTIVKPYVQEQFGGRWLTFAAAWHPGASGPKTYMSTEAWRLASAQPMPAPSPVPTPATPPGGTPLLQAAVAMNTALGLRGYKLADQPIYKAFQSAAGMGADGYPGTGTMARLSQVLSQNGIAIAPVHVYPWHAMPGTSGYNGVNAPTWAEWTGAAAPAPAPSPGVPSMQPSLTPAQQAAADMANALNAHGYKQADMGLYKRFQQSVGLGADGFPGTGTMTALSRALAAQGVPMPPVHIYPWKSKPGTTGYDGLNAPPLSEWMGAAA